jgi:outer membrane protein TolC
MTLPIYEGGALQAQAVPNYGSMVLKALKDVEDAISTERTLEKRLQYQQDALADCTRAVKLAICSIRW